MLSALDNSRVFHYFKELAAIPHGSGNTKAISDYCVSVAEELGLSYHQDELNNVIIKKPASKGYENSPAVILQGHLDMVCEKAHECDIDFTRDPLRLQLDGDWLYAEGTTLGGDDGVAIAMALAVLEDKTLAHPPIEAVFTVDEETGMYGAEGLDGSLLSGRILMNIDGGEEGILTVGCAGGARAEIRLPASFERCAAAAYRITVKGLVGGHSGVEIDKGRLNSNIVMGQFLKALPECRIAEIAGGLKDNAIPVMTRCIVSTEVNPADYVEDFVDSVRVETDNGLEIEVLPVMSRGVAFSKESSDRVIEFLNVTPNGIYKMSEVFAQPETSLNLGILGTDTYGVYASFAVRSAYGAEKENLLSKLEELAISLGGEYKAYGHYPAWEYKEDSVLRDTMCRVFREKYDKDCQVVTIHAGLECGLFSEKLPGLDAVTIGPDMKDIHTCRERLSVSSTERVYEFICDVLGELK